jgi:hypothetical protein
VDVFSKHGIDPSRTISKATAQNAGKQENGLSFTFKSAKRLSPYAVPFLRKCPVHRSLCRRLSFNRRTEATQTAATRHVLNWLIGGISGRETVSAGNAVLNGVDMRALSTGQ